MANRPIIFSGPMVRALIEGRKTQTRRLLRLPNWAANPPEFEDGDPGVAAICEETGCFARLPTALPGDRLYVREAWRTSRAYDDLKPSAMGGEEPVFFESDGATERWTILRAEPGRLRTSMHMPRWASRLTLIVESVKVERLQDISAADAIAEGLRWRHVVEAWQAVDSDGWPTFTDPRRSYAGLWNNLHTKPGECWQDNPWVVAVAFRVARGNIDGLATR